GSHKWALFFDLIIPPMVRPGRRWNPVERQVEPSIESSARNCATSSDNHSPDIMRIKSVLSFVLAHAIITCIQAADSPPPATPDPPQYPNFPMGHDGNALHGRQLFNASQRLGCAKFHSVDRPASRAGPDLFAIGDSYPRRELIRSVLEPSATIAVGYGTT